MAVPGCDSTVLGLLGLFEVENRLSTNHIRQIINRNSIWDDPQQPDLLQSYDDIHCKNWFSQSLYLQKIDKYGTDKLRGDFCLSILNKPISLPLSTLYFHQYLHR